MGYLNKVLLIGRLGQDPEKKVTQTGQSVASISLATTEYYKDKSGSKQEKTEWHKVVFWGKQADLVEQYCKKGSQIYVEGALQTREWKDKDGNKRWTTEVVGRQIQFLDSKGGDNQQGGNQNQGNQQQSQHQQQCESVDDFLEDDVPF